ncbi:hypothetical protein GCM10023347_27250 [Streptomyces chumphonensis]|uniref:Uncharacterized protein n=1 Tax=Streptomyces chumphonensis TaxID=1214925 RepID=A0A927IB47_9ACTN|nr:hypothetical protein [Streptomyces chumphonensis]MBD3932533.1 hypothetical protein [Streptomyces chumphonensis]
MTDRITLMAAGELRDAVDAVQRGDTAAAAHALASIDPESWRAIEDRLAALGGSIAALTTTTKEH